MIGEMWDHAPRTAAMYISLILFIYISGLLFLLIQSVKQKHGEVTLFDIYVELSDIAKFFSSIFTTNVKIKEDNKSNQSTCDKSPDNLVPVNASNKDKGNIHDIRHSPPSQ